MNAAGKPKEAQGSVEIAIELLREAMRPHFKGRNASGRLENAVSDSINAIVHLITVREDVKKNKLGATVMTEGASINKGPGSVPRTL